MTNVIPISLKWGKKTFIDEQNLSIRSGTSSSHGLKLAVQSLTGVPLDRQKLLCPKAWKGPLKDDTPLDDIRLPKGKKHIAVTLIGSAEILTEKTPDERPRFSEDMTPEEIWKASRGRRAGEDDDEDDVVDIVALQKEAGMDRDDGKAQMYQYNRLVTGLPQHQIDDMLRSRKKKSDNDGGGDAADGVAPKHRDASAAMAPTPISGEVAMTMGMELRRAYVNSLAVLANGTIASGLDDGHLQLWRRGRLVKDARHPGARVDHVSAFPPPSSAVAVDDDDRNPSFATAGDGSICLWTEAGEHLASMQSFPGTSPASIAVGDVGDSRYIAACFRITREADPNRFRLVPQNEAERRRREVLEMQERNIQLQLSMASKVLKIWTSDRDRGSVEVAETQFQMPAPTTKLLEMNGALVCGDSWGGIHILDFPTATPASQRLSASLQFQGYSIACIEHISGGSLLAVAIRSEQRDAEILPMATPLRVTRPHGLHIVDMERGCIRAVLDGHVDTIQCICRLPDGALMSAGGKMDATVRVWEDPCLTDGVGKDGDSSVDDEVKVSIDGKILKQPGYVFDLKVLPDSRGSNVYAIAAARYNVIKIIL